jgi:outer membrane receptor protein involved in Fe transport
VIVLALLASSAVVAAQAPPKGEQADAIVVTGERVKRTVRETPSSVVVETRKEIEARAADRVDQVLAAIPNVLLGNGSQGPAIRGQDTTGPLQNLPAFLGGNRPRTTVIVDGRAQTYNEFVFGASPLWDVERIEVFRSPQTTTQGQNSIAGAIFVFTGDPTFEPEASVRAIAGDFHTRQLSALASAPVNGDIALRVAGDLRYSRTTSHIVDRLDNADPNHDAYGLLRAKLLVKPSALPGASLLLTYAHVESQAPQIVGVTLPFKARRDESGYYGTFRINADSLTARGRYEAGRLTATMLVAAGDTLSKRLAPKGFGQAWIAGRDWSGEAIGNWRASDMLGFTGGVSYRHAALNQRIDLSLLNGTPHFRDWQDGTGLFGEARIGFAPGALLTAGMRYQRDSQKRVGAFQSATGGIALDYDRSFSALLPKVSLSYDFSPSLTAGLLVQRAYNPGGTTLRFDTGQPDQFEAEHLWDYELFARGAFAGGRFSANANLFYYDMRNAQRSVDMPILAPNGRPVWFADLFNIPKARSYGMEGQVSWHASRQLDARLGFGLLGTKIVRAGLDYPEFEGREFDRSPHMTASAAVDWRPLERLRLSAQVRHHGPYSSDPEERPFTHVSSGTIADARAALQVRNLSFSAYVRNIFDRLSVTARDSDSGTLEDPREVGVGVEARF